MASPFAGALRALAGVVLPLEPGRVEQDSQDLRIVYGSPAHKDEKRNKHQKAAPEAPKEVKGAGPHERGHKKEPAFSTPDCQGLVEGPVNGIWICHG